MTKLTPRERQVAEALYSAPTATKIIAHNLGISDHTINRHMCSIYEKLGVGTRVELIFFALREGYLQPSWERA